MFEVVFLGTAASTPSVDRGLPAVLVRTGRQRFLIDCGEGTQRQLLKSGVGYRKLTSVLLTHAHLDHILGLPGLVSTLSLFDTPMDEPFVIAGSAQTIRITRSVMQGVWPSGRMPLGPRWAELTPGAVTTSDEADVRCFKVVHGETESLGYVFESPMRRHLVPEKLEALGVPHGPERAKLAKGESIVLADGRTIKADDVTTPPTPGTKLVVVGDAQDTRQALPHAQNADALIIEATFLERDAALARERSHLTAKAAAELARDANVKALYLTHLSGRYSAGEVLAEATAVFPYTTLAHDFLVVNI